MRQFIVYLESVTKVIGMYGSVRCNAISIANISTIWLECLLPGILNARFFGLFSPSHIPHPLREFSFPLFIHDPSVYILIWSCSRFRPLVGACSLWAGRLEFYVGSRNILKHSFRFERIVVDGSKRISPC